jgi:hypothetical protein
VFLIRPIVRFAVGHIAYVVIGLLLLLVAAGLGARAALGHMVKAGIEGVGPHVLHVRVTVQEVEVSVLRGSLVMHGFALGNPEGFSSPHAFRAGRVRVAAKLPSLFTEELVLPTIEADAPELTLEMAGEETNLGRIIEGLDLPEEGEERTGRKFRIGLVRVTNASVRVAGLPMGQEIRLELPPVEIRDLVVGGEPATPGEVAERILTGLTEELAGAGGLSVGGERLEELLDELEGPYEPDQDLPKGAIEALEGMPEELRRELDDLLSE